MREIRVQIEDSDNTNVPAMLPELRAAALATIGDKITGDLLLERALFEAIGSTTCSFPVFRWLLTIMRDMADTRLSRKPATERG